MARKRGRSDRLGRGAGGRAGGPMGGRRLACAGPEPLWRRWRLKAPEVCRAARQGLGQRFASGAKAPQAPRRCRGAADSFLHKRCKTRVRGAALQGRVEILYTSSAAKNFSGRISWNFLENSRAAAPQNAPRRRTRSRGAAGRSPRHEGGDRRREGGGRPTGGSAPFFIRRKFSIASPVPVSFPGERSVRTAPPAFEGERRPPRLQGGVNLSLSLSLSL